MFYILKNIINSIKKLHFGWSRAVKETMLPVANLLKQHEFEKAEKEIAKITLDICSKLENKIMEPRVADEYFTYLLSELNIGNLPLRKEIKELILEGCVLYDQGKWFGADLNRMKDVANKILKKNNNT